MKPLVLTGLLGGLIVATYAGPGHSQGVNDTLRKQVGLSPQGTATDDYLLALGKAADLNFMADATQFPATGAPLALKPQDSAQNIIAALANARKLTWQKQNEYFSLFWSEPDVMSLAQRIAAGEKIKLVDQVLPSQQLDNLLTAFYTQLRGGDANLRGVTLNLKMADLPPAIRSKVVAKAQYAIMSPGIRKVDAEWFTDDIWQTARLRLGIPRDLRGQRRAAENHRPSLLTRPDRTQGWLFLGINMKDGASWQSIARVNDGRK